jgi:hypothetical protein
MKLFRLDKTSNGLTRISSAYNSRNKSFLPSKDRSSNILSPIRNEKKLFKNTTKKNCKNLTSFDSTADTKIKRQKSAFSFKTNLKGYEKNSQFSNIQKSNQIRPKSSVYNKNIITKKWRFSDEPVWKKFLRGKLLYLLKNNIILCEKKFNPNSFTESISNNYLKEFKNKFKNMDDRNKVGIFTNKYPNILNQGNKFYSRYFDYFVSPDELLYKNFTKEEIFQIKADPIYFNFGNNFENVKFFQKRSLKETLNEEEKLGPNKLMDNVLKYSLRQTKKRIKKYMDYYTSVMARQGIIS